MKPEFTVLKEHKSFSGTVRFCEHESKTTKTKMKFSTFTPSGKVRGALIWLSGLTCSEENFMAKAGAQAVLQETGLMVICPDTSPRGLNLPGESENWDFGVAAGFYVDSTTPGYSDHYRMYTYISEEIYALVRDGFDMGDRIAISGHSMGGHGALVLGLREPAKFRSVSAFSPIVNPTQCPWGEKAFTGYLGDDRAKWKEYDTCELLFSGRKHANPLLVDQGSLDSFLAKQLLTPHLKEAVAKSGQKAEIRMQEGYDHSYYFVSTFIADHVRFHAKHM